MRIAIMGSGGVGGYFGGRLAAAGCDVTFIARGAHLAALRGNGLRIDSPAGSLHLPSVRATDTPREIGAVDLVLFAVKMYDTEQAADAIRPIVRGGTGVVSLQNGVDAVAILTRLLGREAVIGGTAYVAAVIGEPGVIRHTAMARLVFGELDGTRSARVEQFHAACAAAGIEATISDDVRAAIWSKFVRLSVFSGMTAVTRSPMGVVRDDPELLAMLQAACEETRAVGLAAGVALGPDLMGEIMAMVQALPWHSKSSMLEDLERGRRLELPWLSGAVVRLGLELGVPTPIHRFMATVLKPFTDGAPARAAGLGS